MHNLRQMQRMDSLRLMQHPIDAMLQFDANVNANANIDASVNGPLLATTIDAS